MFYLKIQGDIVKMFNSNYYKNLYIIFTCLTNEKIYFRPKLKSLVMKLIFTSILSLFSLILIAQSDFKQGFFIKNNGVKVNCLIEIQEWEKTPDLFRYKLDGGDTIKTISANEVQEIEIGDITRLRKINAAIDISNTRTIMLKPNQTFLAEVLVDGKVDLLKTKNKGVKKYFYTVDGLDYIELIQKEYVLNHKVRYNNDYLVKINKDVMCDISSGYIDIRYHEKSLQKHFIDYNECKGQELNFIKKFKSTKFNALALIGFNSSKFDTKLINNNVFLDKRLSFDSKISLSLGAEGEMLFPSTNYTFGLGLGALYRSYNSSAHNTITDEILTAEYSSIEMSFGPRYFLGLSKSSKLVFQLNFVLDNTLKNNIQFPAQSGISDSGTGTFTVGYFSLVAGYRYKKLGIQAKYSSSLDPIKISFIDSKLKTLHILLSYKVL